MEKPEELVLVGPRLRLRPYEEDDVADFYRLIRKNELRLAPAFPGRIRLTRTLPECRRLLLQFQADWRVGQVYAFGVWLQEGNNYIGDISLKNFDRSVPKAEVGYYLGQDTEGRGLGTEMLQLLLDFAFRQLQLNKVFLRSATDNPRSYNLAERCGFTREGLLRQDFRNFNQNLVDIYYYGLTRQDYESCLREGRL